PSSSWSWCWLCGRRAFSRGGDMSLSHGAHARATPSTIAARPSIRTWPEINNPAAWIVGIILLIMPLIANGFFLIEIFGTTLILGIVALSLMFLAGYGGMVSLM